MYSIQENPDFQAVLDNGATVKPLVTLKDEFGGISHIIKDDHCLVLINGNSGGVFKMTYHWYPEAVEAMIYLQLKLWQDKLNKN